MRFNLLAGTGSGSVATASSLAAATVILSSINSGLFGETAKDSGWNGIPAKHADSPGLPGRNSVRPGDLLNRYD